LNDSNLDIVRTFDIYIGVRIKLLPDSSQTIVSISLYCEMNLSSVSVLEN